MSTATTSANASGTSAPAQNQAAKKLTKKDFDPGIDVRWCPGCGDYAILAALQRLMPDLGVPKENIVFVSGIGCSSRFPYYMDTFGFHTIHGRAPAVATGLKCFRPDLSVWVITGDGDALSIGGNHLIHALRRNVNVKILLFNNRIYGLTKGQYSPTSEVGKVTKSTPFGSLDQPLQPLSLALGAEASFVARAVDTDVKLLQNVLRAAHEHQGAALVEIFQNCNVFNDGAFDHFTEKKTKAEHQLVLEHGKPMVFGKAKDQGVVLSDDGSLKVVQLGEAGGNNYTEADCLVHQADHPDVSRAFALSRIVPPAGPMAVGVLRQVERPTYDGALKQQLLDVKTKRGPADFDAMLRAGDTWTVAA